MARFRNRDRSNRSGRGQIEHNVLEGLPINQYREIEITIGPNSTDNKPVDINAWPELPMPRDSHMLPEHSQQLLRAARSGRTIKPPAPPEDDDNEMKDEETEHKEVPVGFTIKKYVKVARHNEAPEPEYLAKRRKGLPSQYINGQVQAPLRETKVKKLDAEGNVAIYKVLAPEGQAVEGEVAPTDAAIEVVPVIAAPGTVVEGVGVVNAEGIVVANDVLHQTPPRRRAPPPKKKKGGPGRRRKVIFAEGAEGQGTPAPGAGGDIPTIRDLKQGDGGSVEPSDRDTPMGEAGEDDESGEDGSDNEEQDLEDGTPVTPSEAQIAPTSAPVVEMIDAPEVVASTESTTVTEASTTIPSEIQNAPAEVEQPAPSLVPGPTEQTTARDRSSSPDLPISAVNHSSQNLTSQLPTSATSVEPVVSEPVGFEPIVSEPIISEPITSEPITSEPITSEPVACEPVASEPVASEPVASEPDASKPVTLDSIPSEPAASELEASEPAASEMAAFEPVASEPILAPVPSTETESVSTSVDVPTGKSMDASVSGPESEVTKAPTHDEPSVPPSEIETDLLGSLEAELDKGS